MPLRYRFLRIIITLVAVILCARVAIAQNQSPKVTNNASVKSQEMSAHSEQDTTYATPADRANDALIITEVKTALANDGVTDGFPITVGADHGLVVLTGVLGSQDDIQHAISIARSADGVKGVQSRLTLEKTVAE
jgi:osmotically-inducible protein OsmY